jgi:hypothetical protein
MSSGYKTINVNHTFSLIKRTNKIKKQKEEENFRCTVYAKEIHYGEIRNAPSSLGSLKLTRK